MPLRTDLGDLTAGVFARMDARLCRGVDAPLALALSGGGDSVALLALAVDWVRANGRRVLALTVDHGLNPDSANWSRRCEATAHALGADWRGLRWEGAKPANGLPAAARAARHALLADAAREAGAAVVLMGHTADDVDESDAIRAEGTPIGRLRGWSPSPAWPEGRGVMLLRPMLDARREDLRDLLRARGLFWIEDPANADVRFARARVRLRPPRAERGLSPLPVRPPRSAEHSNRPPPGEGTVLLDRAVPPVMLAAAVTCVGGGARTPRGARLGRLIDRLRAGDDVDAVLCGARLSMRQGAVIVHREPGEQRRQGLAPLELERGRPAVWDGRFEIAVEAAGWRVVPAQGRMNRLSVADRAALAPLPAAARGAEPVLIRDDAPRPVLARTAATVRSLVEARLAAALDATSHEAELIRPRMAPADPAAYLETDPARATTRA